jgi:Xaa-Pro aminopeptidase
MEKRNIGLMFLTYGANLWYLTGVRRNVPQLTNENAYGDYVCGAYISTEEGITLIAPRMGGDFFQAEAEHKPWIQSVRIIDENEKPRDVLRNVINDFEVGTRGVSLDDRSWAQTSQEFQNLLPDSKYYLASQIIDTMRMVKDADEIATMRKAGEITDRVYGEVIEYMREGLTERDVECEVDRLLAKNGAEYPSFTSHVTFTKPGEGTVAARRGANRQLSRGHSVSFDFGMCYEGYCSDFGRTAFVGEPPVEFRKMHDLIMEAQASAIKSMISGKITATKLDRIARNIIVKAGYGDYFTHRLGHGIGVTVHEPPFLYPPDDTTLVSNMTFTVEPSIRIPNSFACRVEDVVMVSEHGGLPFTNYSKELTIIKSSEQP